MTYLMRQTKDETMPKSAAAQAIRRATKITLPVDLLAEARALGLNVSQACEQGLKAEIAHRHGARWLEENREALISLNDYVEYNGLPLSEFRQF
jgi:antitoxin CcdA